MHAFGWYLLRIPLKFLDTYPRAKELGVIPPPPPTVMICNHKVPLLIPGSPEISQLSILPRLVNRQQHFLGVNLRCISVPSKWSQRLS